MRAALAAEIGLHVDDDERGAVGLDKHDRTFGNGQRDRRQRLMESPVSAKGADDAPGSSVIDTREGNPNIPRVTWNLRSSMTRARFPAA